MITLWLSGLSGCGKSTIANEFKKLGYINIDGDDVRKELNKDLGLTDQDRSENVRRIACIAKLLNDQGYNVVVSCISKNKNERLMARDIIGHNNYKEVCLFCPEKERINRDPKGLYKKYGSSMLSNYEPTTDYDHLEINTTDKLFNNLKDIILFFNM